MGQRNNAIRISLIIVMTALTAVSTMLIQIPIPLVGYFNLGDVMIFVSALTFGPIVGGFAGGIGSAIADMILGYPQFAIPTLIIKGLEGLIAGSITNTKQVYLDVLGVIVAGVEMIVGYFIAEWLFLGYGYLNALAEIPANIGQIAIGGIIGIPIAILLRRRLPENLTT